MTNGQEHKEGTGRASWPVLVSLALNLFLIGLVAAPILSGEMRGASPMPPPPEFVFDQVSRELAPEEARKLRGIFDEERRNMRLNRDAMHETMTKVAKILEAETPDLVALKRALDEIPNRGQALHERMARAFSRMATELSLESRRKIAQKIKEPPGPRRGGRPPPGE